ncbi:MAG: phosphate/phosphite/phosphonate ABC transporter substrate-binding protein [bacterium]
MINKKKIILTAGVFVLIFLAVIFLGKKTDFPVKKETLKAGEIDKTRPVLRAAVAAMLSPKSTREYYDDLLTLVGRKAGFSTEIVQRQTYSEINELLEHNELDVAFVCSGPYVEGRKKFGMKLLAVPVVRGEKVYRSYILVNIESPVKSFKELRGKKFAFVDPHSNTGFLVPKYMLAKMNETPKSFFKETFYTYSHDKSMEAVANNLTDGCAVDGLIWDFMKNAGSEITSKTKVIEKSPPYGIPPVVVNPSIKPELEEKLRGLFLTIHEDMEGKKILAELQIDRFEEGFDTMYVSVSEMQDWINAQEKE